MRETSIVAPPLLILTSIVVKRPAVKVGRLPAPALSAQVARGLHHWLAQGRPYSLVLEPLLIGILRFIARGTKKCSSDSEQTSRTRIAKGLAGTTIDLALIFTRVVVALRQPPRQWVVVSAASVLQSTLALTSYLRQHQWFQVAIPNKSNNYSPQQCDEIEPIWMRV